MDAVKMVNSEVSVSLQKKAAEDLFTSVTPGSAKEMFFYLFKAWVCPPAEKKQHLESEIARFMDQVTDLVDAAFLLHQANLEMYGEERHD